MEYRNPFEKYMGPRNSSRKQNDQNEKKATSWFQPKPQPSPAPKSKLFSTPFEPSESSYSRQGRTGYTQLHHSSQSQVVTSAKAYLETLKRKSVASDSGATGSHHSTYQTNSTNQIRQPQPQSSNNKSNSWYSKPSSNASAMQQREAAPKSTYYSQSDAKEPPSKKPFKSKDMNPFEPPKPRERMPGSSPSKRRKMPSSFEPQQKNPDVAFVDFNTPQTNLSDEQRYILDLVVHQEKSVFFTGNAGTGKSHLLREIIRQLLQKHGRESVAVTASTGLAACSINGTTLHSFAGVGLGHGSVDQLVKKMRSSSWKALLRWNNTKVLIVDEVSMVEGEFFDKLEEIARIVRKNELPFGGIQLVLCGDFMQLPPVGKKVTFAFEAKSWSRCLPITVQLKHIFRQRDPTFINLLNEIRHGRLSQKSIEIMQSLSRELPNDDNIVPTELFSLREEVDKANNERLSKLPGQSVTFTAEYSSQQPDHIKKLKDSSMAPDVIELKINSQVMLLKNISPGLVNGSVGIVCGFNKENLPIVKFKVGNTFSNEQVVERAEWTVELPNQGLILSRVQLPLMLAYAMSIHKSQGQTIEKLKVDISKVFEKGQVYVALSRATSLENVQLTGFSVNKIKVHQKVIDFHRSLEV